MLQCEEGSSVLDRDMLRDAERGGGGGRLSFADRLRFRKGWSWLDCV